MVSVALGRRGFSMSYDLRSQSCHAVTGCLYSVHNSLHARSDVDYHASDCDRVSHDPSSDLIVNPQVNTNTVMRLAG